MGVATADLTSGAPERDRFSLEGLQESRRARAAMGVVLTAVVLVTSYVIVLSFTGHFTDVVKVKAQLPLGSNAVPIDAPVEYRNVTVGKVGAETQAPNGGVAVVFFIYPQNLARIPAGVQAQVAPLSIFGNQYVDLVPPPATTSAHLLASDFVAPYGASPSTSLQGTVTQLYDLLQAVHPADLETALTAFAQALDGQGHNLGHLLAGSSDYSGAVVPHLPALQNDLGLLGPVNSDFNQATPSIVGTIANSAVTARTIIAQQSQLHALLSQGAASAGQFAGVLHQVQVTPPALLNDSGPLFADITQTPDALSRTLSGLTQFSVAAVSAETDPQGSHHPYLSVTARLPVHDISAGVNAALGYANPGSIDTALGPLVNPATYTPADCPQYPGTVNRYCAGHSPAATPTAAQAATYIIPAPLGSITTAAAVTVGSGGSATTPGSGPTLTGALISGAARNPAAAEQSAVDAIAASLNGGRPAAARGLAQMVLLPLLSSLAAGH